MIKPSLQKESIVVQHFCKNILPQMLDRVLDVPLNSRAELILLQIKYLQLYLHRFCYMQRRIYGYCNIQDGALCDIVNGWKTLAIITRHSILDVAAALDPPLICFFEGIVRQQNKCFIERLRTRQMFSCLHVLYLVRLSILRQVVKILQFLSNYNREW